MKNNFNLDSDKLNELFEIAGKKMGISPEKLKEKYKNGISDSVIGNIDINNPESVNELLKSPGVQEKLKQNKKAAEIIKMLLGEK